MKEKIAKKDVWKGGVAVFVLALLAGVPEFFSSAGAAQLEYVKMAEMIMSGAVPYRDFPADIAPAVYYLYAAALALSKGNFFGIFLLDVFFRAFTAFFVYLLAGKYFGNFLSILCGLGYGIIASAVCIYVGWCAVPFFFAFLFAVMSIYYFPGEKIGSGVVAGITAGLAMLTYLPMGILVPIFSAVAVIMPRKTWEPRPKRAKLFSYLYGVIIVVTYFSFYLLLSWSFDDFMRTIF